MVTKFLHTLKVTLRNLSRNKLRSGLTLIGVVLGVGSVIVMIAMGEGARAEAIEKIVELGSNNVFLRSAKPVGLSEGGGEFEVIPYGLDSDDLDLIRSSVPYLQAVAPSREHRRDIVRHDRRLEGRVVGVTPEYQELNRVEIESGSFVTDVHIRRFSKVAVVASEVAQRLFPMESPIGKHLRIGADMYFEVIGVTRWRSLSPGLGTDLPPQDLNRDIYIPYSTDRAVFGQFLTYYRGGQPDRDGLQISQIMVSVRSLYWVKPTAAVLAGLLGSEHRKADVTLTVPLELLEKVEETQNLFTLLLGSIASISLLVGGIGIMNIMLATVTERTGEIGIRRALGAKRRDIVHQFLVEAATLSSAGGLLGILLGLVSAHAVAATFVMRAVVPGWSIGLAFGISVATGLIFGIYPARRASRMHPIDALRHE